MCMTELDTLDQSLITLTHNLSIWSLSPTYNYWRTRCSVCGRYCSNRAAAVFNKHLKWLHVSVPILVASVLGDTGHKETRLSQTTAGVMRKKLCVWFSIWLIATSSWDSRAAEMEKCVAPLCYLLSTVVCLRGCGLHARYCPQTNEREMAEKAERETSYLTRLASGHDLLNIVSQPRFQCVRKDQKCNVSLSLPSQTKESFIHWTKSD